MIALEKTLPILSEFDDRAANFVPITVQEMRASLLDTKGAEIFSLIAQTLPTYRKTNCPFRDNIVKVARVNGLLNFDYQNSVNNQRVRENAEPAFESMPRAWGTALNHSPFVSHVNKTGEHKLYLKMKVQHSVKHLYYTLAGDVIPEEDVVPFLHPRTEGSRQGVDKPVIERDYTVSNILAIAMRSIVYRILH